MPTEIVKAVKKEFGTYVLDTVRFDNDSFTYDRNCSSHRTRTPRKLEIRNIRRKRRTDGDRTFDEKIKLKNPRYSRFAKQNYIRFT